MHVVFGVSSAFWLIVEHNESLSLGEALRY